MNAIKSVVRDSTADDLDGVARDASPDIGCYECQEVMGLQMLVR